MPAVVEEEEAWGLEMATDSVRDLGSIQFVYLSPLGLRVFL